MFIKRKLGANIRRAVATIRARVRKERAINLIQRYLRGYRAFESQRLNLKMYRLKKAIDELEA